MKSYSANATFISNIYTQEVGDTNWNEYQVVVTGGSNSLNVRSADTTSNNLAVLNETRVSSNDTLLLSVDGSNVVSGTCGLVTTGTIKTQTSTPTIVTARSSNASPLSVLYTSLVNYAPRGYKLKPDGKVFWAVKGDATLIEFNIGTVGSMNTATTTGKTLAGCQGIDFSTDGKYLFRMTTAANQTVERLTLSTPWDISTVVSGSSVTKSIASIAISTAYTMLRMQPDGLGFALNYQGIMYKVSMTTAWDVSTATYAYQQNIPNSGVHFDCTSDGKTWYWTAYSSASTVFAYAAVAGTAWDFRTLGTAVVLTCSDSTYMGNSNTGYIMAPLVNLDGSLTLLPSHGSVANAAKHATFNVDIGLSKNIDISAFGLSSAPTAAWLKMPNIAVATGKTSSTLSWSSKELELDGNVNGYTSGIAATTTTAVVGIDGANVLTTGDSVLLNGTTTVTLSNVVETSNGLAYQDVSNAVDYIKYSGKTLETGTGTSNSSYGDSVAQQHMRFSNDGAYCYVFGGNTSSQGVGVYQFVLSTPWDITTGSLKSVFKPSALGSPYYNSSYTLQSGFDINPDGTSFIIVWGASNAQTKIHQYKLSKAHNLDSTITTSVIDGSAYTTGYSGMIISRCRFNRTGTQLLVQEQSSANLWTWYQTLTTPYDITTLSTTLGALGTGSPPTNDECFIPNGNVLLALGTGWSDGYLFSMPSTVTNSWATLNYTRDTTTNATYTNWPANTVTTSTNIRSLDVSVDGTRLYIITNTGTIYQFNVRLKTLNKYALTFSAQGSAPTSVSIPASVTTPTMTTSVVSGNIVQTSNSITTNSRAIQFKLTNNPAFSEITKVQLNLRKSA